jgi:hypothetical protein
MEIVAGNRLIAPLNRQLPNARYGDLVTLLGP